MLHRRIVDLDGHLFGGCQLLGNPPGLHRLLQCCKDIRRRFVLLMDASAQRCQRRFQFGFRCEQFHLARYAVELIIRAGTELYAYLNARTVRIDADERTHDEDRWTLDERIDPGGDSIPEVLEPAYDLRRPRHEPMWIPLQTARPYVVDIRRYVQDAVAAAIHNPDSRVVRDVSPIRIAAFPATHNRVKAQRELNRSIGHGLEQVVVSSAAGLLNAGDRPASQCTGPTPQAIYALPIA